MQDSVYRVAILYSMPSRARCLEFSEAIAEESVVHVAGAVAAALRSGGHAAELIPLEASLDGLVAGVKSVSADVVFNLFEGFDFEPVTEPIVPLLLEERGLRYTGNPPAALALALHKDRTNAALRRHGIAAPGSLLVTDPNRLRPWNRYPALVRPAAADASHGITPESVVHDRGELRRQAALVVAGYGEALVQPFLEGREFNVAVLGNSDPQPLPPSEVMYTLPPGQPRLVTFGAKWRPDDPYYHNTNTMCPAHVEAGLGRRLQRIAGEAYRALGCRGYARFDLRLDEVGEPLLLDANPNPDLSPDAGLAAQARAAGMSYPQLIEHILALALERPP